MSACELPACVHACVRAGARAYDIIQPKAPRRKGEGLLCPSVPRAKDRGQMSADGSLRLRRHGTASLSVYTRAPAYPCARNHCRRRRTRARHPPNAHGYCVSFDGIFGDRVRLGPFAHEFIRPRSTVETALRKSVVALERLPPWLRLQLACSGWQVCRVGPRQTEHQGAAVGSVDARKLVEDLDDFSVGPG